MLLLWQLAQGVEVWAPASAKYVACRNGDLTCHVASLKAWHWSQAEGNPAWLTGEVALWKSCWWQAVHGLVGTVV